MESQGAPKDRPYKVRVVPMHLRHDPNMGKAHASPLQQSDDNIKVNSSLKREP